MIVHRFVPKAGVAVITPEDEDDLWSLRRIISRDDLVSSETKRVIKARGFFSRPDKGERVDVFITIRVEKIGLDSSLSRLRIAGIVVDASSEAVSRGSHHSIIVAPGKRLALKKQKWSELQISLMKGRREEGFFVVAIDRREAGVGRVKGTHLELYPTVSSGFTGKLYQEKPRPDTAYYSKVAELLKSLYIDGYRIFIAGPGVTKQKFASFLKEREEGLAGKIAVIEGIDVAGEDGVYATLKSEKLKKALEEGKLKRVSSILDEVIRRITTSDERVALGFKEVDEASRQGAVESLVVSEGVFEQSIEEEVLIELVDRVEEMGGSAYLVDSSTELGNQASALGGLVALLRFKPF